MSLGNQLIFLGTAGGRIATVRQLRATGGLWLRSDSSELLLDPGPGCLVRSLNFGLSPSRLSAIILTHKHLDHSADINVMVEAMTDGGLKRRGFVYLPGDAIEGPEPVVFPYLHDYVSGWVIMDSSTRVEFPPFSLRPIARYIHGNVETFRFLIGVENKRVALFVDGKNFYGAEEATNCDLLIVYCILPEPREGVDHFSLKEAKELISLVNPKKAILTHFGASLLKLQPWNIAQQWAQELGFPIIAAWDNMVVDLSSMEIVRREKRRKVQ
ncbi:MAG: MBL fold metallo-hydrolase [bacterium JZ-2024 1]